MKAVSPDLRHIFEQSQKLVIWVFREGDGQWAVRREGDVNEQSFPSRDVAIEFARCMASASIGYKLFIQLAHGHFAVEYRNFY